MRQKCVHKSNTIKTDILRRNQIKIMRLELKRKKCDT